MKHRRKCLIFFGVSLFFSTFAAKIRQASIMDEQLKQIGERLKGLRDVLDLTAQEVADTVGISLEKYEKIEAGEVDITISNLM